MKRKRSRWTPAGVTLLFAFLMPVAVMLAGFIIDGIYPFGKRSFLSMDLYHQYMPFFTEFMRSIKNGNGLFYTWNVGVGSNFLALYVYYLASPFFWLGLLVPESGYIEFLSYLTIVKIGFCGMSCCYYLQERSRKWQKEGERQLGRYMRAEVLALAVSVFYALSGFLAAYNWNVMWLDCVVLFPLIILGLERLVEEGRPFLYCITLALSILTNYYISIMICMFLVLYFVFLYATSTHGRVGLEKAWRRHLRPIRQFAVYSLLAGGIASVLLIPEVCAILATDFGKGNFTDEVKSYFSVFDMLARHCVAVSVEKGLDHWPNIYCGAAVFLFVPMYATCDRIPVRKRFGTLALAGFLLLSFSTNVLNYIWHGLNYPDSLPARQSFIYIFLMLLMCFDACGHLDFRQEKDKNRMVTFYLVAVGAMLFVEKFAEHEDIVPGAEWLTLLFITLYAGLCYVNYVRSGKIWRQVLVYLLFFTILAESGVNTCCTSIANVNRADYLKNQSDYKALYRQLKEEDSSFVRVEKMERKTKNDGTLAGYPTASVFSSTLDSKVKEYYKRFGMRHSKVYYGYDGATAFSAALLNVGYVFGEGDAFENELYSIREKSGDITLYEANYRLPFGYVAPAKYTVPGGYVDSGIRLQNQMVHELGIMEQLFEKQKVENVKDDVHFTAPEDGIYYGIVTATGTTKIKRFGGGKEQFKYQDLKKGSVLYLGDLKAGSMITLSNGDEKDESPKILVDVYRMNEEVLAEAIGILSQNALTEVSYDSTSIKGRISLTEAGRLILSVPYEKGWKVRVNGEKVEPELFGDTFMAFDLEPGEYELELKYVPYGLPAGIAVSILSVLVFAGIMVYGKKIRLKRMKKVSD